MSLSSTNRSVQLLMRFCDGKTATEPMIEYGAVKPEPPYGSSSQPLPRQAPERQGIPSSHIAAFLSALHRDPSLRMHSVMILRNGHVICEAAFGAQDLSLPRMTFSACKSITSLAIGILIGDGLLQPSDRLIDHFPDMGNLVSRRLMKEITIEQLLSMRTGNQFNELSSMTQEDWVQGFFASPGLNTDRFQYNSLNTYMLSALVCKISNMSLSDFLKKRLFGPMGIDDFYWERCPSGVEKGGWGLYMRPEDLAKLGQLIQDGGMWNGTQLVPLEYLAQATTVHAQVPEEYGDYNYGWQFWVGRTENTVLFNGMLGQNVLCFRDSGITLVSHAGNDETFQQSNYFKLASRFFGGSFQARLPRDLSGGKQLNQLLRQLRNPAQKLPDKELFQAFHGKRFVTASPRAASAGLLPLTLQAVQNCYTKGVQAIAIGGDRELVEFFYEERDCLYQIHAGTKTPYVQTMAFGNSKFRVAAQAKFTQDEDGHPVLRLQLDFLETPCQRIIKVFLTPHAVAVKQSETPCMDDVLSTLFTTVYPTANTLLSAVLGGSDDNEYLQWKMSLLFAPTLRFTEE